MTLHDDYSVLRTGAACAEVAPRGLIGLSGRDRGTYLHGLLTNDISTLKAGAGCYAAWLTAQGRMTTDMHVLESGDVAQALVNYAVGNEVSVIVMGAATHGLKTQRFVATVPIKVAR